MFRLVECGIRPAQEMSWTAYAVAVLVFSATSVLALYALQVLPVNYAGLALVLLGLMFMIAEAFVPSVGILGVGGVAAWQTAGHGRRC